MKFQELPLYIVVNDHGETLMYIGADEIQYPLFAFTNAPPHLYHDLTSAEIDALSYGGTVKRVSITIEED